MPPTPEWSPIDVGARSWSLEQRDSAGWSLRTIAVPLADRKLLVVSPIKALPEETFAGLAALGEPDVILAPNHFHHLGVPEWHKRFPSARLVASERALPRLSKKCPAPMAALSTIAGELPAGVSFLVPDGTKSGETWVRLEGKDGVVWIVSDAFFYIDHEVTGVKGFVLRLLRVATGDIGIGTPFKIGAIADRAAYRSWVLKQIDADHPRALVVGHGSAVVDPALPDRLRRIVEERLG